MSEYLKQLKIQIASKVQGVRFQDVSPLEIMILKERTARSKSKRRERLCYSEIWRSSYKV